MLLPIMEELNVAIFPLPLDTELHNMLIPALAIWHLAAQ